jgi:anti-sigma-K factor RskA
VLRPLGAGLAALALLAAGAGGALLAGAGSEAGPGEPGPRAAQPAAPPARVVTLEPLAPVARGSERARVALPARAGGTVRVAVDGVPALPSGEYLELWLLGEGDQMVSLGTFRAGPDGRVRVALPLGVDPAGARFVDLSVEREDGDPTHSGKSVLRSAALS